MEVPDPAAGAIWARVPDGYRPGAVWRPVAPTVDLPLVPLADAAAASPFTIVIASDTHVTPRADDPADPWDGDGLAAALGQAIDLPAPPRFVAVLGDLTQGSDPASYTRVQAALAGITVPFVPVVGNHDWFDGGVQYPATFGVTGYSFDIQRVHFVVWDTNLTAIEQVEFVAADLARVDTAAMTVVLLGHVSPPDVVAKRFAELGVDYLFTGHWHANRRADRFGMVEWTTQPLLMAGLDDSPAGYRVVTFTAGVPTIVHRERMVAPHLELVAPRGVTCVPPDRFEVVAAASISAGPPQVRARIDCGAPFQLAPAGGWDYRGTAPALAPGVHAVELIAETPSGIRITRDASVRVCAAAAAPAPAGGSWPQVGGGPAHHHAVARAITPPLVTRWATPIGGTPAAGTPVIDDGTVVVAVIDRGAGDGGGVVALDLATGAVRWRVATASPVVNAPAIADGIVVVAASQGEVIALELATGRERWRVDLGLGVDGLQHALWGAPLVADGVVYAGVQGRFAAIRLATGEVMWSRDPAPAWPWLGSRATPAIAGDEVIAAVNRTAGLLGFAIGDGAPRVITGDHTIAINAAPVVVDHTIYVVNSSSDLTAIDARSGALIWSTRLDAAGFDWGYSTTATPAYAGATLYVPTKFRDLIAFDLTSYRVRWRATSPASPINLTHYRSNQPGFVASPVVTGDLLWVGRPDGTLLALATADGAERWSTNLGAPITTSPAPAGDILVVATYDGTVRALAPGAAPPQLAPPAPCAPWIEPARAPRSGCGGCTTSPLTGGTVLFVIVMAVALAWRRRPLRS
jgi:outer membrane protein assembly factor BamB